MSIRLPDELPLVTIEAGNAFWRVHDCERAPLFFGPRAGKPPANRFDAPNREYRTLYAGLSFTAAFVETLLREPHVRFIDAAEIEARCMSELTNTSTLNLVDLRGAGLSKIGMDNSLSTGPYEVAGRWALALWSHAGKPDGIVYRCRHDPNHAAAAIFDRPRAKFEAVDTVPLIKLSRRIGPILNAHGKGIA